MKIVNNVKVGQEFLALSKSKNSASYPTID